MGRRGEELLVKLTKVNSERLTKDPWIFYTSLWVQGLS